MLCFETKYCEDCTPAKDQGNAITIAALRDSVAIDMKTILKCSDCITNGRTTEKFDASFVQDAEWEAEPNKEKDNVLFHCTLGYISW